MNVVLIGGTGNISSDCAEALLMEGHNVYALTRGNHPVPKGVSQITTDRSQRDQLKDAVKDIGADVVIDFLGFTTEDMQIDIDAFAGKASQLIFISSCTVYAKPHRELPVTEAHPVGNVYSEYARKKQACEEFLLAQSEIPVTIVRPSHTFSKKWSPNCVRSAGYTFVDRLERGMPVFVPGDGNTPWTLTSTSDFAKGLCGLVGNDRASGETFHITSEEHPTWKDIYLITAELAGAPEPDIAEVPVDFICDHFPSLTAGIKGDKCVPSVFDNSKIKSFVPSFECTDTVRGAIRRSIEWMRAHPEDRMIDDGVGDTFENVVAAWRKSSTV